MGTDVDDEVEDRERTRPRIVSPAGDDERLGLTAFMVSVPLTAAPAEASVPDPAAEQLRARIAEQRATGEWEPWFVELPESQDAFAQFVGLPASLRAVAAPNLKRLYPPNICRKMLRHGQNREVIDGLFNRWLPFAIPLIRIGVLLENVGLWPGGKLVDDLQSAEGFAGGRTELEVWASLAKAGFRIDREPLGAGGKRPDFAVYSGGMRYVVEVKTLLRSDGERMAEALRLRMSVAAGPLMRPGQVARVWATAKVRNLLDSVSGREQLQRSDGTTALAILREESDRLAALGAPLGRYMVGEWFAIEVALDGEHPLGTVACGVWDGPEEERRAVRFASVVEAALEQIPPTALGVVVVEVGEERDARVAADALTRRATERPVLFSPLAFVAVRWKSNVAMRPVPTGVILPHRRAMTNAESRLASVLLR